MSEIRLNEDELEQIITTAAKRGVEIYKREEQKKHKADKYHDTYSLMRCYRDAVFHRDNAVSEAAQLQQQGELTEEQQATYLRSIRRTRFKTILMLDHIDKAVEEIERRRQQQGREEEKNLEKKDSILAGAPPEHFLSPFLSELGLTMKHS